MILQTSLQDRCVYTTLLTDRALCDKAPLGLTRLLALRGQSRGSTARGIQMLSCETHQRCGVRIVRESTRENTAASVRVAHGHDRQRAPRRRLAHKSARTPVLPEGAVCELY